MSNSKGCVYIRAGTRQCEPGLRASRASAGCVCGFQTDQCGRQLPAQPAVLLTRYRSPVNQRRPSGQAAHGLRHGPCHPAKAKAGVCCYAQKAPKVCASRCRALSLPSAPITQAPVAGIRSPGTCSGRRDPASNNSGSRTKGFAALGPSIPRQSCHPHSAGLRDGNRAVPRARRAV